MVAEGSQGFKGWKPALFPDRTMSQGRKVDWQDFDGMVHLRVPGHPGMGS